VAPRRTKKRLTHVDAAGRVQMVDVSQKADTVRTATARALLVCTKATRDALVRHGTKKGEAVPVAKVAGVLAAKQTGALIPLCHPIALTDVTVAITAVARGVAIEATATCVGKTGVEMEAMVAASIAGLCLYDMGKAIEREMTLTDVELVKKSGGKSGDWVRARGR
jgi:cyclic pyranopterin monophosphate synthase